MTRTFRLIRVGDAHRLTLGSIEGWPEDPAGRFMPI